MERSEVFDLIMQKLSEWDDPYKSEVYQLIQLAKAFGDESIELTRAERREMYTWDVNTTGATFHDRFINGKPATFFDGIMIIPAKEEPLWEWPQNLKEMQEELIDKTIAQQKLKIKAYDIIVAKGLPILNDLRNEVESNFP